MKKIFLLLGGNQLNSGIVDKFQKLGYLIVVIDWNKTPQIQGDRHYQIDVKDHQAILNALKKDNLLNQVGFVYSSIDLAVGSVVAINRALGLKTMEENALLNASSKTMMTKTWREKGLLNRLSQNYKEYDKAIETLNAQQKIIIKPDNSSSSRGITIVEKDSSKEILKKAFQKAQQEATNHIVLVEEFIEGVEFTAEMLGDSYGNVRVYGISRKSHTKNTIQNKIAVKLHYNAVSLELQEKIAEFAIACYKALGFSSCFGHLELILKEDGSLTPLEIGARSSGFIASPLVDIVSGCDYVGELEKVLRGESIQTGLHPQTNRSSLYFFYDIPIGAKVINTASILDFCDKRIKSHYSSKNWGGGQTSSCY